MKLRQVLTGCIAVFLTAVFSMTAVMAEEPASSGSSETVQSVSGNFEYEIQNGGAVITGYTGTGKTVNIPASINGYVVWKIGNKAFMNQKITSVTIPSSVSVLGDLAFAGCTELTSAAINSEELADASSLSATENIVNGDNDHSVFYNAGSLNGFKVTFGSGVTRIPAFLFATSHDQSEGIYCRISSVVIPDSVTEIGERAFNRCYKLSSVQMGSGVRTIGKSAFRNIRALKTVALSSALTSIGECAFRNTGLQSITIPKNVTGIGDLAFADCDMLTSMTVKAVSLTDANSLSGGENIVNGDIDHSVFYNAGSLSGFKVTFSDGVKRIPGSLFATGHPVGDGIYCRISEVTIPDSVTEIGDYAFKFCYKLASVKMGTKVQTIGSEAFSSTKIQELTIPSTVTKIGKGAFGYCKSLKKMTINAINLADADSISATASDGWGIYDTKTAVFYNAGTADGFDVIFGEGVTKIPAYLFATGHEESSNVYCRIAKVTIPASAKSVGVSAFYRCYKLKNVYYTGTKAQWNSISIGNYNENLTGASLTYIVPLKITKQPAGITVNEGDSYSFTVSANGKGLKYAWYYKSASASSYTKSSVTTATYSNTAKASGNGMKFYCVVSDVSGNSVKSNTVTLTVKSGPSITAQPVSTTVGEGKSYSFSIKASGSGLKYAWYYKSASASTYTKSSVTSSTYKNTAKLSGNGMQFYCIVTDSSGRTAKSSVVKLTVAAKPKITVQPKSLTVSAGSKYSMSVSASGTGLKYTWYYKSRTASSYTKSTVTSSTYTNTAKASTNGMKFYVVVTDKYGNSVTSSAATLTVK